MRNLLQPKWLFLVNTLPVAVLLVIFFRQYHIIHSLLDAYSQGLWRTFGLALFLLGTLNFLFALLLVTRKRHVPLLYCCLAMLSYIVLLYLYGSYSDEIFPFSIPQWMLPSDFILYPGTFLMPTLVYSLLGLMFHITPESKSRHAWKNFVFVIVPPAMWYLFVQIVLPLWQAVEARYVTHVIMVFTISCTLVFLFFLVRGIYIVATKKKGTFWKRYELLWKFPVAIVFPLLGLAFNNGLIMKDYFYGNGGIFGDFGNQWFYILAFVNGFLICLPEPDKSSFRLVLFVGRSITFSFTFYFFLVFLPFLPVSVVAIVLVGLGFLMLTPLALFVIHVQQLSRDFSFLASRFSGKLLVTLFLLGFAIIPACITGLYMHHKHVLNETLEYLYTPDYKKHYDIDKNSLRNTLNVVKFQKKRGTGIFLGSQIPYLTSCYNWLVMDNLMLADTKINTIERVFFAEESFELRPENGANEQVKISRISTRSTYDEKQKSWLSWVDLEVTNRNETNGFGEFATILDLPEGCWISDYYLYIGRRKEPGILAEKKSAMWVFSQILNQNRDPGILYYLGGNKVSFRVFPFAVRETRKTGIEFLHKEPVQISIGDSVVTLGNIQGADAKVTETENAIYIPAAAKQSLKKVQRRPYFHFLVDISRDKNNLSADFIRRIEKFSEGNRSLLYKAQISYVNSDIQTFPFDNQWKEHYQAQSFEGGFYLSRAIKSTLFKSYQSHSGEYPVMVVVTDRLSNAVMDRNFSDFRFAYPESDLFYNLTSNGKVRAHSLLANSERPMPGINDLAVAGTALEYIFPNQTRVFLPDDSKPSIVLKQELVDLEEKDIQEKNWPSGLDLQAQWMSQVMHPETTGSSWLSSVKYSFLSHIMTPSTSFLVTENDAQKAVLLDKQKKVLAANPSLDLGEDAQRMSEPGMLLVILMVSGVLWYREYRRRKKSLN